MMKATVVTTCDFCGLTNTREFEADEYGEIETIGLPEGWYGHCPSKRIYCSDICLFAEYPLKYGEVWVAASSYGQVLLKSSYIRKDE